MTDVRYELNNGTIVNTLAQAQASGLTYKVIYNEVIRPYVKTENDIKRYNMWLNKMFTKKATS